MHAKVCLFLVSCDLFTNPEDGCRSVGCRAVTLGLSHSPLLIEMHYNPGIGYRQSQFDLQVQNARRCCLGVTEMKRVVLVERARHGSLSGVSAIHCCLAWNLLGLHGLVAA
jgi:hypothetical protein